MKKNSPLSKPLPNSFAGKLSSRTGLLFDLPTEAQWEYACRAGTPTAFNNNTNCSNPEPVDTTVDPNLEPLAWYGGNWNWKGEESGQSREVGLKQPNAWGLYDMHGQLWEFCLDWYAPTHETKDAVDPTGPPEGERRVVRGGSWHAWPALCRSANRHYERGKFLGQGFRLVCSAEGIAPSKVYMIVDVSGGPETASYPVTYSQEEPEDLLINDAYKTTKIVLRRIPAGTFVMGSPLNEAGRDDDELQHEVTLTRDFYICLFPVTQKQWASVEGHNPSAKKIGKYPVETVSWEEIRGANWPFAAEAVEEAAPRFIFADGLRARTGLSFDLPTEAQWEYACRAGAEKAYHNDKACLTAIRDDKEVDANLDPIAWYGGNWNWEKENAMGKVEGVSREVGLKQPNAWGSYDMLGNVWEYCLDWYGEYEGDAVDPVGPSQGIKRVARGGNWHAWPAVCRSANRQRVRGAFGGQGVRIACSAEGIAPSKVYMIVDVSGGPEAASYPVTYSQREPEDLLTNDAYKATKIVLRRIPAGTFTMGSPPDEVGRDDDEVPHRVTLTQDFYLGVFLVTQRQWELVTNYNPSVNRGDKLPVENLSWEQARSGDWPPEKN